MGTYHIWGIAPGDLSSPIGNPPKWAAPGCSLFVQPIKVAPVWLKDGGAFVQNGGSGQKQIFYRDGIYGSEQSLTRFGAGNAWDPRWSPTADVVVLVANEGRNEELWLVRKGEWPAVQLTDNEWAWDKHPTWSLDGGNQRQLRNFAFAVWAPVWVRYSDQ